MVTNPDEITTVKAAYSAYVKHFPKKAMSLKTALFHYLLPYRGFGLDFRVKPGGQLRGKKIEEGWEHAEQIKLEDLWEIERVLTWQAEVFESCKASRSVRRPNKHYLKHFLEWCKGQGHLKPKLAEPWGVPQSLPGASTAHHRRGGREKQLIVNRQFPIDYGADLSLLSDKTKLHLAAFAAFWTDEDYEGTRPLEKTVDKATHAERVERLSYVIGWLTLDKLDYYHQMRQRAQLRKERDSGYESGWLEVDPEPPQWLREMQEKYPPRPLSTFELEELVPIVEIRPEKLLVKACNSVELVDTTGFILQKIQDELKAQGAVLSFDTTVQLGQALHRNQNFEEEVRKLNQVHTKLMVQDEAKTTIQDGCEYVRSLLKHFFKWLKYQHNPTGSPDGYRITPSYRVTFCTANMNLAKFFYREITNSRTHPGYADIEIVMELRKLGKEERRAEFKPNQISPIKRDPTWKELGKLLKELLVACAPRRSIASKPDYTSMGPMRRQTAVARDFQKYLIMMFFRLIAPDRQHVVRELKEHDTLKLCWINGETRNFEEAVWDKSSKKYKAHYNSYTKSYYLDIKDVKDEKGSPVENPQGKPFTWVVYLDASQTKIDQDNAYQVPKIYNPELESWLHGQEDYSGTWFNWPPIKEVRNNKWSKPQYHWCGYVDLDSDKKLGFRDTFKPTHDFVFTQSNGKPFTTSNMCRFYDAIIWRFLAVRSNPHAVRSAVTGHFKLKGMTTVENEALAKLKSHSVRMQDSPHYNKLAALEKTSRASEMIVKEFLQEHGLDPEQYGLVGDEPDR